LEARLAVDSSHAYRVSLGFSRGIFDAVITGPLWTLPDLEQLWSAIAATYRDTNRLTNALHPMRWLPFPLGAILVAAFSQGQSRQRSIVILGRIFAVRSLLGTPAISLSRALLLPRGPPSRRPWRRSSRSCTTVPRCAGLSTRNTRRLATGRCHREIQSLSNSCSRVRWLVDVLWG
jgi:hypothetical protein